MRYDGFTGIVSTEAKNFKNKADVTPTCRPYCHPVQCTPGLSGLHTSSLLYHVRREGGYMPQSTPKQSHPPIDCVAAHERCLHCGQ